MPRNTKTKGHKLQGILYLDAQIIRATQVLEKCENIKFKEKAFTAKEL